MTKTKANQWTILKSIQDDYVLSWIEAFLIDRKVQGMSAGTLYFYQKKLALFMSFLDGQAITRIFEISPTDIRQYIFELQESGHNSGGVHACYRALKTFLRWYEAEAEPGEWSNPIKKVKAPKVPIEPLEPVQLEDVKAMILTCEKGNFFGERDRAILYSLLDTGARASEFVSINLEDLNLVTGAILIRSGKGSKPRMVYLGKKSRKAVRAYLKQRNDLSPALWITDDGERLTYSGLRQIIRRRAKRAGIECPGLHDFRRAFALNFLRNNPGEIYALQRLMGHADIQVLRRYLAQTEQDIQAAHRRGSPVDISLK